MKHVTISVAYVRKLAATYRHLKQDGVLPRQELTTVALAAKRCLTAHAAGEFSLAPDVRLPLDAVVRMLETVQAQATAQLLAVVEERVPVPEDFASSSTPEVRSLVRRAAERLAAFFGVPA